LGLSRRHQPRRQPRRFTAQGFFGGVLIPMAFTLVFTKLPQQQKPIGLAMFALAVTFAPAIGPTIGGYLTENYGWQTIFFANVVRAVGQALTLAPLSSVTLGSVAPQDAPAASGISNMLRNLGGAIGTAVLATIVTKREQFHSNIIGQSVDLGREEVRTCIGQLTNYFIAHGVPDPANARHQAIVALGNIVKRQALLMDFSDTAAVIGVVLLLAAIANDAAAQGPCRRGRGRALRCNG
jgi:MFS family permease